MKAIKYLLMLWSVSVFAQGTGEKLSYHSIQTDAQGKIVPWYSPDPGIAYDHIIQIVWNFWDTMRVDLNGLPYHMNHQVWTKDHNDHRGIGGDQIAMALSSWRLLYAYTGNERIIDNMRFMADYYFSHSLSPSTCMWKNLPFPYNTLLYSGIYDGDMILGKGFVQPDKAGSFGSELVNLYKLTGKKVYLDAAVDIAKSLAEHITPGDNDHSPLPFRVNAFTGKVGVAKEGTSRENSFPYTSNWSGTMILFRSLVTLGQDDSSGTYQKSFDTLLKWMKQYPLKTNKWGPFFEDVDEWSDTQINAATFARFILENQGLFPEWKTESRRVLDWVYSELKNPKWEKYGAWVVNEQTAYRLPGNSHTARQGAAELLFALKTGDAEARERGIRQLSWATYMVNTDGESTYPNNETWMTDGYGDYVRHYLRAMESFPELAPANQNHLVSSSSVIKKIEYQTDQIRYETFDGTSVETLRLTSKPKEIWANNQKISESDQIDKANSWQWKALEKGGVLKINHGYKSPIVIKF
jgi:hypothetical protein